MNTAILNPSIQHADIPFIAPKLFTAKRTPHFLYLIPSLKI